MNKHQTQKHQVSISSNQQTFHLSQEERVSEPLGGVKNGQEREVVSSSTPPPPPPPTTTTTTTALSGTNHLSCCSQSHQTHLVSPSLTTQRESGGSVSGSNNSRSGGRTAAALQQTTPLSPPPLSLEKNELPPPPSQKRRKSSSSSSSSSTNHDGEADDDAAVAIGRIPTPSIREHQLHQGEPSPQIQKIIPRKEKGKKKAVSEELKKRKRYCYRCKGSDPWVGETWEKKKTNFHELGQVTLSYQQKIRKVNGKVKKNDLTPAQKSCLIGSVYDDDGNCLLCLNCFSELTGSSYNVKISLSNLIREKGDRSIFLFDQSILSNKHSSSSRQEK